MFLWLLTVNRNFLVEQAEKDWCKWVRNCLGKNELTQFLKYALVKCYNHQIDTPDDNT